MFTYSLAILKGVMDDMDLGAVYPRLLSDTYKTDLSSAIFVTTEEVEKESDVKCSSNQFNWVSLDSKPEYAPLQDVREKGKNNKKQLAPGVYISYMCSASTRSGLFIMTPKDNFSNLPCVQIDDKVSERAKTKFKSFLKYICYIILSWKGATNNTALDQTPNTYYPHDVTSE